MNIKTAMLGICLGLGLVFGQANAARIKDLASIAGVRDNQLLGYGLVVGLDGSGDKVNSSPFTEQSLKSLMTQLGIATPPGLKINPKNVAAVMVNANLPAFAKPGQTIDITVSSVGDAKSLRGGTLLMTPLKGADGKVYAIAQGNLVVGGLKATGQDASSVTVNNPSVGRIPQGATVEKVVKNPFTSADVIIFNLHRADFTTAAMITDAINKALGPGAARAMDATSIGVRAPKNVNQRVPFMAMLEGIEVKPGLAAAKVIINSRTGTVVINNQVRVSPAAVAHGSLVVTINEEEEVSQPAPLSQGETAKTNDSTVYVNQNGSKMFFFNPGVDLNEVVKAINQIGAGPDDLIAILDALKEAGALHAELIII